MNSNRRRFLTLSAALLLVGPKVYAQATDEPRSAAAHFLARLDQGLRTDRWTHLSWAFSPDFLDLPTVRQRWEARWIRRDLMEVQFTPGRVQAKNGLLHVPVGWVRSVRDRGGRIERSSGKAELILEPFEGEYRIRQVLGESFF